MQKMPVSAATYLTRVESLTVHHRFEPPISYLTILPLDARYSLKIFRAHGLTAVLRMFISDSDVSLPGPTFSKLLRKIVGRFLIL